jgi:pimeloyl-ACP methyl ester carboxylesterase
MSDRPIRRPAIPRSRGRARRRFVRLAGIDVHHEVAGRAEDPTVVLLHHFYGSTATWRHVLGDLGRDHHVAAFDRPGFGLTERPDRHAWRDGSPYTRAAAAGITLGLLDELGAEEAVLVGSSAGGTVALETYARAPERVRALVLLSPAITGDVGPTRGAPAAAARPARPGDRLPDHSPPLPRPHPRAGHRSWHDPARATEADLEAYRRPLRGRRMGAGAVGRRHRGGPPQLGGLLRRIDVPTLVVAGTERPCDLPRWNARTARAIPGARLEVLPACGHTPQEECPRRCCASCATSSPRSEARSVPTLRGRDRAARPARSAARCRRSCVRRRPGSTSAHSTADRWCQWSSTSWKTSAGPGGRAAPRGRPRRSARTTAPPPVGDDGRRQRRPSSCCSQAPKLWMSLSSRRAWLSWTSRPGQLAQQPPVAARLEHVGLELHAGHAGLVLHQLELLDVVAQLVDPPEPLVDPVALVVGEDLVGGQLRPQALVALTELLAELERVHVGRQDPGACRSNSSPAHFSMARSMSICAAPRSAPVQLTGLRVDQ